MYYKGTLVQQSRIEIDLFLSLYHINEIGYCENNLTVFFFAYQQFHLFFILSTDPLLHSNIDTKLISSLIEPNKIISLRY